MPPPPSWIRDGGGGHEGGAVASPLGRANSLASFAIASQQNKDAAIRAGKREQWTWMQHEAIELVRAFEKAGAASLWAWDDLSVSHTKRRVSAIDNVAFGGNFDGVREKIDAGGFLELQITTVSENAEEGLQGLKRTLRKILSVPDGLKLPQGLKRTLRKILSEPDGLKLPQAAGGFRDVSEGNLDDALAASLGFESLDVLLSGIPDACRWSTDGTRLEAMREASRHEVHTWALTQGGVERPGLVYVADLNGVVSAEKILLPKTPPARAALKSYLPYDDAEKILLPETPPARATLKSYRPYDDAVVYEDLTEMSKIHLPSLLHNTEMSKIHLLSLLHDVEARFLSETIYSYIGNMLIAVNPYKPLTMPLAGNAHPCFIYGREPLTMPLAGNAHPCFIYGREPLMMQLAGHAHPCFIYGREEIAVEY
ncbi:hypothetical protein T484DRAFT_1766726 [Baffinella frigidus]|nr:hypothetical protein T484DRAFT_1766726 [Cryptophyta sp. CCMP2293]